MLYQSFDLSLVIALAGAAEAIGEQVVTDQSGEGLGALALGIAADLRDRDLGVVIQNRTRHGAAEGTCRSVPVEEGLGRLSRIDLHEAGI